MNSKTRIEYTVQVWQEGNQFVAHAMPLDVMSCGPTPASASQSLQEAVELYLATSAEMDDTLTEVLEEAGYKPQGQRWISPTYTEIPVSLIRNNLKTAGLSRDEYFSLLEQVR